MATIAQQLSQVQQIESAIPGQEEELRKQQAEAEKIRAKQLDVRRQLELQKAGTLREFQARGGLAGEKERARKERERRFGLIEVSRGQIRKTKEDISEFKQSLSSDAAKLQYAKEQGLKGRPIYDRVVKGGTILIVGYEYSTPFGKVIDYSPRDRLLRSQARLAELQSEAIAKAGFSSPKAFFKGIGEGLVTSAEIREAGLNPDIVKPTSYVSTGTYSDIEQRAEAGDTKAKEILETIRPVSVGTDKQILSQWEDKRSPFIRKVSEFKEKTGDFISKAVTFAKSQPLFGTQTLFGITPIVPPVKTESKKEYIPPTIGEGFSAVGKATGWAWDKAGEGWGIIGENIYQEPSKIKVSTFFGPLEIDLKDLTKEARKEQTKITEQVQERIKGDFESRGQSLFLNQYLPKDGLFIEKKSGEVYGLPVAQERFQETESYKELSKQYGKEFKGELTFGEDVALKSAGFISNLPTNKGELFYKSSMVAGIGVLTLGKGFPALGRGWSALPSGLQTAYEAGLVTSSAFTIADPYSAPTEKALAFGVGTLSGVSLTAKGIRAGTSLYSKASGLKTGWFLEPTKGVTALRSRATIIVKDEQRRVLFIKDPISGKKILVGGGYKGTGVESARKGALKELFEETGLRVPKSDLKYLGEDITFGVMPQKETVFELVLKGKTPLLKPTTKASEIGGYVWAKPKEFKLPGGSWFGGKKTQIGADWIVAKYNNLLPAKYSKGFPTLQILPAEEVQRTGGKFWLAKRIPQSSLKNIYNIKYKLLGKIKGKVYKPGQFLKWQKETPIIIGGSSRYEVPGRIAKQFETYAKPQLQTTASPTALKPKFVERLKFWKKTSDIDITLAERGYKVQEAQIGLYQSPPIKAGGKGYVATDYLGIRRDSLWKFKSIPPEAKWNWNPFSQPTIVKDIDKVKLTPKALSGVELESYIRAGQTKQIQRFGGSWVSIKGAGVRVKDIIKNIPKTQPKTAIGRLYSSAVDKIKYKPYSQYVPPSGESPYGFGSVTSSYLRVRTKTPLPSYKLPRERKRMIPKESTRLNERRVILKEFPKSPERSVPLKELPRFFYKKIPERKRPTFEFPKPPVKELVVQQPTLIKKSKQRTKFETGFRVFGKRRGKFGELTRTPVTKREALAIGTRFGVETLGRTFKIQKTGQQVEKKTRLGLSEEELRKFRRFKIRGGRKVFEEGLFIQKRGTTLGSRGERTEILRARKQKKTSKGLKKVFGLN